jgi:hypothetical protein
MVFNKIAMVRNIFVVFKLKAFKENNVSLRTLRVNPINRC